MGMPPHVHCLFAPGEGFRCPVCGACPDDEAMLETFRAFDEDGSPPTGWLVTAPCCGTVLPFNAFENSGQGFARLTLGTACVPCGEKDVAELGRLGEASFKAIYTRP